MSNIMQFSPREWRNRLQLSSNGIAKKNLFNTCVALRDHPYIKGRIAYDEFKRDILVTDKLPWSESVMRPWDEHDDLSVTEFLQGQDLDVTSAQVREAVHKVAYENRQHQLRSWMRSLVWDNTRRIDTWLTYYLGVDQSPYVQTVGRAWLISAVARIMSPGCKADGVLIIEGPQGIKKSTALRVLAGEDFFTDQLGAFGDKDTALQMCGRWIIELAELDHMGKAAVSRIKAFLSNPSDSYRPPYGHRTVTVPRECVFAGTVNDATYLRDSTGNRRFWPVTATSIDIPGLERIRNQIWAEAVAAYDAGDAWWITDAEIMRHAEEEQRDRVERDVWADVIDKWRGNLEGMQTGEILMNVIGKAQEHHSREDNRRIREIMMVKGFKLKNGRDGGEQKKAWRSKP